GRAARRRGRRLRAGDRIRGRTVSGVRRSGLRGTSRWRSGRTRALGHSGGRLRTPRWVGWQRSPTCRSTRWGDRKSGGQGKRGARGARRRTSRRGRRRRWWSAWRLAPHQRGRRSSPQRGAATQLVFSVQPRITPAGEAIMSAVAVTGKDAHRETAIGSRALVTVAIGTNPGTGTLGGTLTHAAVGGVATFANLSIDKVG